MLAMPNARTTPDTPLPRAETVADVETIAEIIAGLITCNGLLSGSRKSSREVRSRGEAEVVGIVADGFRSEGADFDGSTFPKEKGATRAAGNRTAYCRQQAVECALAATTAILGEV